MPGLRGSVKFHPIIYYYSALFLDQSAISLVSIRRPKILTCCCLD
jgi:hypothetical protein